MVQNFEYMYTAFVPVSWGSRNPARGKNQKTYGKFWFAPSHLSARPDPREIARGDDVEICLGGKMAENAEEVLRATQESIRF